MNIIGALVAATAVNILFHFLVMHGLICALRILCHALLFDVFFLFTLYDSSRVPGEKNAIELTESRSEAGFMVMKEKIEELSQFLPRAG